MWLLRNKDLLEYKNYLELFNPPEEETNIPKLQIFKCEEEFHEGHPNCCPVMIGAVQACNYDKKTKEVRLLKMLLNLMVMTHMMIYVMH